jgi:hypothetical protein
MLNSMYSTLVLVKHTMRDSVDSVYQEQTLYLNMNGVQYK